MKFLSKLPLSTLVFVSAVAMTTASVSAYSYQEQYQEVNQSGSSKITISCQGNGCSSEGTTTYESKASQSQSQSSSSGESGYSRHKRSYPARHNKLRQYRTNAAVELTWDHRGGTCEVRYTEAQVSNYRYNTSTSCDEGGITIGGLRPGVRYRFQVRKDGEEWQAPVTLRAY